MEIRLETNWNELWSEGLERFRSFKLDKLCPVCFDTVEKYGFSIEPDLGFAIVCRQCKFIGPYCQSPESAIDVFKRIESVA